MQRLAFFMCLIVLLLCACGSTTQEKEPEAPPVTDSEPVKPEVVKEEIEPEPVVQEQEPEPVEEPVSEPVSQEPSQEQTAEDRYNSLTNKDKLLICDYIQDRYDYYDELEGGYAGDKYSDTIWEEAAAKYGLTTQQISLIWGNLYSYNAN